MHSLKFQQPVLVAIDFGAKVDIRSVLDMHRFLTDWPPSRRTSVYSTAVRACQAAREGHLTVEQARRAFVEFAKVHDILWFDMEPAIAQMAVRGRHSRHI